MEGDRRYVSDLCLGRLDKQYEELMENLRWNAEESAVFSRSVTSPKQNRVRQSIVDRALLKKRVRGFQTSTPLPLNRQLFIPSISPISTTTEDNNNVISKKRKSDILNPSFLTEVDENQGVADASISENHNKTSLNQNKSRLENAVSKLKPNNNNNDGVEINSLISLNKTVKTSDKRLSSLKKLGRNYISNFIAAQTQTGQSLEQVVPEPSSTSRSESSENSNVCSVSKLDVSLPILLKSRPWRLSSDDDFEPVMHSLTLEPSSSVPKTIPKKKVFVNKKKTVAKKTKSPQSQRRRSSVKQNKANKGTLSKTASLDIMKDNQHKQTLRADPKMYNGSITFVENATIGAPEIAIEESSRRAQKTNSSPQKNRRTNFKKQAEMLNATLEESPQIQSRKTKSPNKSTTRKGKNNSTLEESGTSREFKNSINTQKMPNISIESEQQPEEEVSQRHLRKMGTSNESSTRKGKKNMTVEKPRMSQKTKRRRNTEKIPEISNEELPDETIEDRCGIEEQSRKTKKSNKSPNTTRLFHMGEEEAGTSRKTKKNTVVEKVLQNEWDNQPEEESDEEAPTAPIEEVPTKKNKISKTLSESTSKKTKKNMRIEKAETSQKKVQKRNKSVLEDNSQYNRENISNINTEVFSASTTLRRSGRARRPPPVKSYVQYLSSFVKSSQSDVIGRLSRQKCSRKTTSSLNRQSTRNSKVPNIPPSIMEHNEDPEDRVEVSSPDKKKKSVTSGRVSKVQKKENKKQTKKALENLTVRTMEEIVCNSIIELKRTSLKGNEFLDLFDGNKLYKIKYICKTPEYQQLKDTPGVSLAVTASSSIDGFGSGMLKIEPGKLKPRTTNKHSMIFNIMQGQAEVVIQDKSNHLRTSGTFLVPKGTEYYIKNTSKSDDLLVTFTMVQHK